MIVKYQLGVRFYHTPLCGITYSFCINDRIRFLIRNH